MKKNGGAPALNKLHNSQRKNTYIYGKTLIKITLNNMEFI